MLVTRLDRLRALRSRIDREIADEERRRREVTLNQAARDRRVRTDRAAALAALASSPSAVRAWAKSHGYEVGDRGRVPTSIYDAYLEAHPTPRGSTA